MKRTQMIHDTWLAITIKYPNIFPNFQLFLNFPDFFLTFWVIFKFSDILRLS